MRSLKTLFGFILAFAAATYLIEAVLVVFTDHQPSTLTTVTTLSITSGVVFKWAYEAITGEAE